MPDPADPEIEISGVVPFYNEQGQAGNTLDRLDDILAGCASSYEFIAVDDGSPDGTCVLLLLELDNRGNGIRDRVQ